MSIIDKKLVDRAEALVQRLTLDEKINMVHGAQLFQTKGVSRLGIPPLRMSDGPMGVRQEFKPAAWQPIGRTDDYVTYLPCNSALAATWNRELAYAAGSVLGEEARGRGKDVILAPGINIKRSPLCGRNFEYFSEDPYLTKEMAVPFIRGVQNWDVAACVKHFAANNQETERLWVDVEVDEEALRKIYLPAFFGAVAKGGSYTVMGAYNKVKGEHCCQSEYLLHDILRKEWGYDGVVISDWGGAHNTEQAANSQLDIEMSVTDNFEQYYMAEPLKRKIENGEIAEEKLDEKVTRILMLMMRLHMLEEGEGGRTRKVGTYNTPEHRKKALDVARESIVLLKNERSRLPLCGKQVKRLLIIGENAVCTHADGGGSAEIKALYEITPLMGIQTLLGGNTQIEYTPGYCRDNEKKETQNNWQETSLEEDRGQTGRKTFHEMAASKCAALREEALAKAAEYDDVIFIGGLNHEFDSEGIDREDMKLPYGQDELISGLLEIRPEAVITFVGGSPIEMTKWVEQADTVVWSWYAGMEGGRALAEVLFGEVNPSGKLPDTFYKSHTDCSAHALGEFPGGKTVHYREGVFVGYRYNDTFHIQPQFCFGYGLSYTTFSYENPVLTNKNGKWQVCCDVENVGGCVGKEIVQVYLAPKVRKENEPEQELKGFEKVSLEPGEKKTVVVEIEEDCGTKQIRIGKSSREISLILN